MLFVVLCRRYVLFVVWVCSLFGFVVRCVLLVVCDRLLSVVVVRGGCLLFDLVWYLCLLVVVCCVLFVVCCCLFVVGLVWFVRRCLLLVVGVAGVSRV